MTTPSQIDNQILGLALGRLGRMASRPSENGDVEAYERIRSIFFKILAPADFQPSSFASDYGKGDVSQWGAA